MDQHPGTKTETKPSRARISAKEIWRRRMTKGLSQDALAQLTGVSSKTISNLENGVSSMGQPRTLKALADAFGCEPLDLLEGQAS